MFAHGGVSALFIRWIGLMLALTLSTVRTEQALASLPSPTKVRVKIVTLSFPLEVATEGLSVRGVNESQIQNISYIKNEKVQIDLKTEGGRRVWILRRGNNVVRSPEPFLELRSSAPTIKIGKFQLAQPVLLSPKKRGRWADLIVAVDLEKYLEGVLMSEMPASWPLEALKTQAIAARSYTLFQLQARARQAFQLEGSVLDQAFALPTPSPQLEKIKKALRETEQQVLMQDGKVIKAYYHSDCGGQTEQPNKVWGGSEDIGSVVDTHCSFNPKGRWSFEITKQDLSGKIPGLDSRTRLLEDLQIVSRTPSQRVGLIAFNDGAHQLTISGEELRRLVGYDKLKSTLFSVTQNGNLVKFNGRGYGHGSGLCQWGARYMAENGSNFSEILHHYYPRARISELDVTDR